MKKLALFSTVFLSLMFMSNAHAFDAACEPIFKAGETRANVPAWQSVTVVNGNMKIEFLKSAGQHFMRMDGGAWKKMPLSPDDAERTLAAQARSGEVKMTQCKDEGSQSIDGVDVTVISYTIEMMGAPAAKSKLYIGKADGLPYAQIGEKTESHYRYKGIDTP